MPRRPAADRFDDLNTPDTWPPSGEALADAIRAVTHPRRRAMLDLLAAEGPASVGSLSRRSGLAPGSVSHHARVLARAGLVEPAPELAGDTRETWWRAVPRSLSWGADDFAPGTAGAELVRLGGRANLEYLISALSAWGARRDHDPWYGTATDTVVAATHEEMAELAQRLTDVIADWSSACRARAAERSESTAERRPVRAVAAVFPAADLRG